MMQVRHDRLVRNVLALWLQVLRFGRQVLSLAGLDLAPVSIPAVACSAAAAAAAAAGSAPAGHHAIPHSVASGGECAAPA
jgi:hypothetical protein